MPKTLFDHLGDMPVWSPRDCDFSGLSFVKSENFIFLIFTLDGPIEVVPLPVGVGQIVAISSPPWLTTVNR